MEASGEYITSCCTSEGIESVASVTGTGLCDDNDQHDYESIESCVPQMERRISQRKTPKALLSLHHNKSRKETRTQFYLARCLRK